jgi:hypothetical protein
VAISVALVLVIAGTSPAFAGSTISPTPTAGGDQSSAVAPISDAQSAGSDADARAIALQFKHAVTVATETTPTVLITAQPDGTMQAELDQVPSRVLGPSGWTPLDLHLTTNASGWLAPTVAYSQVEFSPGGSGSMARVRTARGVWLDESWSYGALPKPTVSGATATYANVFTDIDLQLTATAAGMSEVVVVKNAAAAANPNLATLTFGMSGGTVVGGPQGAELSTTTPSGDAVVASTPLWWDSSGDKSGPSGAGGSEPRALTYSTTPSSVSVDASSAATAVGVTYPVYIDPDWNTGLSADWYTDRAFPNQSYLDPSSDSMGYGISAGVGYMSRAYFQFDMTPLMGKVVSAAHFSVNQTYANSCDTTPTQVWRYGNAAAGFTWNTDPGLWYQLLDAETYLQGGGCAAAGWIGFNVLAGVSYNVANSIPTLVLGMRTANEADSLTRKHYAWNASLIITYNSPPATPTAAAFSAPPRACGTAASPAAVPVGQAITATAAVSDPDGGNVGATVRIAAASALGTILSSYSAPLQAQGTLSVPITPNLAAGNYAFNVVATDGALTSAPSAWCYFNVTALTPTAPTVALDNAGTPVLPNPSPPVVTGLGTGNAITIDVIPALTSDTITGYEYWWKNTAWTASPPPAPLPASPCATTFGFFCATAGAAAPAQQPTTAVVVAPTDKRATLWVAAIDSAGNISTASGLQVNSNGTGNVDPNGVDYSHGHAWITSDPSLVAGYPAGTVSDQNSTTAAGYTKGQALTLGAGLGITSSPSQTGLSGVTIGTALNFPYVPLYRAIKTAGTEKTTFADGAVPTGYGIDPAAGLLGEVSPVLIPGVSMVQLWECTRSTGERMTTVSPTCEGQTGYTIVSLGYAWVNPIGGSTPSARIYRCLNGADHFESLSATCEGFTVEHPTAYLAEVTPTKTTSAVVDSSKSFTVSAWVYPTHPAGASGAHAILSQSGTTNSAITLAEGATAAGATTGGIPQLCMTSQLAGAAQHCVSATDGLTLNSWSHIVGVWDPINRQLQIIVNDISAADVGTPTPVGETAAVGPFLVGASTSAGVTTTTWDGLIADPEIYPGVIDSAPQQGNLDQLLDPNAL